MAVAKPFSAMPFPLGKITPDGTTPLAVSSNFTDMDSESVNSLWIQCLPTNTGLVYILAQNTATAKDTTNFSNVVMILAASQGTSFNGKYMNQVRLGSIWIDVDNAGEGVLASIQEV